MPDSFVHLHLHTEYSTLDGANRIPDVFKMAKQFGMPAVAITDHGNLFGAVDWVEEGAKTGVKPIVGCEVYMAPGSLFEKKGMTQRDSSFHFTLRAENEEGYRNLVKLVSIAHLDGMHYKPRIDREHLAKYSPGLIGMSACLKGEVAMAIHHDDDYKKAKKIAGEYREILGAENFFLEMRDHGMRCRLSRSRAVAV